MKLRTFWAAVAIAGGLSAARTSAALFQQTSQDNQEATRVAEASRLLSQGNIDGASAMASGLYAQYPNSASVASLVVQTTASRSNALSALAFYERWVGPERPEQREIVRFIAIAFLREAARDHVHSGARAAALDILVREGDSDTILQLQSAPEAALTLTETTLLASRGDERAVQRLLDALQNPLANKPATIAALGRTHHPRAVKPLAAATTDPDPVIRLSAAQALGALRLPEAIPALKSLLSDSVFVVHLAAATALFELKDESGVPWLREVRQNKAAGNRLVGLAAMKSRPDPEWLAAIRELTTDADSDVRRQAAGLLSPHDPDLARTVLQSLMSDPNPAERQAAQESLIEVADDIAFVRASLHTPDSLLRVHVADRLLELTR